MSAGKLRPVSALNDQELSQELYNCAAFLVSATEGGEGAADDDEEVSLELVALLLRRATAIVEELCGQTLAEVADAADDEDREILHGTRANAPTTTEEA